MEDRGHSLAPPWRQTLPTRDSPAEAAERLCEGRTRFDPELPDLVRERRALGYERRRAS